jgi:D-sedoheptulose 7-phosphate isomerase
VIEHLKAAAIAIVGIQNLDGALETIRSCRDADRMIYACGNGGSASMAAHFVTELLLVGKPIPAICLSADVNAVTCVANDHGFDAIFVRQLLGLAMPGDVLVCMSGSGTSPNVIRAVQWAKQRHLPTIGMTGSRGTLRKIVDVPVIVPSQDQEFIETGIFVAMHTLAYELMEGGT